MSSHQGALERNFRLNFNKITLLHDKIDCFSFIFALIINDCTKLIAFGRLSGHAGSVTVDLDLFLGANAFVDKEFGDVTAVVSLELNNVAPLRVLCGRSIAAPGLLKVAR